MKCLPESPDPTTNREWLEEQQNRLLGFEILEQAMRGRQEPISLTQMREKMVMNQLATDYIYRRRFLPTLLKKLGANNFQEALTAIRGIRDKVV